MSTPIRTQVLNLLETDIATIISGAQRHPSIPVDRTHKSGTMCFLFDGDDSKERRNRIVDCTFTLQVEIWIEDRGGMKDISDTADLLEAQVEHKLMNETEGNALIKRIDYGDTTSSKFYVDETLGGIVLNYDITYSHKYGNPYEQLT